MASVKIYITFVPGQTPPDSTFPLTYIPLPCARNTSLTQKRNGKSIGRDGGRNLSIT